MLSLAERRELLPAVAVAGLRRTESSTEALAERAATGALRVLLEARRPIAPLPAVVAVGVSRLRTSRREQEAREAIRARIRESRRSPAELVDQPDRPASTEVTAARREHRRRTTRVAGPAAVVVGREISSVLLVCQLADRVAMAESTGQVEAVGVDRLTARLAALVGTGLLGSQLLPA